MSEDYIMTILMDEDYERVTNLAGIKTTICKNRFEVICQDRAETNDQQIVQELRAWLARRKEDALREDLGINGKMH
jgi:hypothetical protein